MARQRYKSGKKKGKFMSNRAIAAAKTARKKKRKTPTKGKRRPVAKAKKRRRRRKGAGGGTLHSGKTKLEVGGAGVACGYLEMKSSHEADGGWAAKIPDIKAIGPDATKAGLLHLIAANTKGFWRYWADRASLAYSGAAGIELGRANLKVENVALPAYAAMQGAGPGYAGGGGRAGGDEIAGTIEYGVDGVIVEDQ